jgi:uncharacterized repeat protein (TIGR03943 family)
MSRAATLARAQDTPEPQPVRWSAVRIAGGLVLSAWAILFWTLFLTGRVNLYLSTRTSWVVPVGATLLTLAAAGRLLAARVRFPDPLSRREAVVLALMTLPVVIVLALPPETLGTFSASKKASYSSVNYSSPFGAITATSEITLLSVAAAQASDDGARALAQRQGAPVDFVGFVARYPDTPADEFMLTRYVITCCIVDATTVAVRVVNVPPGDFATNDWVEVKGTIYPLGHQAIVEADPGGVTLVPQPAEPYLTP